MSLEVHPDVGLAEVHRLQGLSGPTTWHLYQIEFGPRAGEVLIRVCRYWRCIVLPQVLQRQRCLRPIFVLKDA